MRYLRSNDRPFGMTVAASVAGLASTLLLACVIAPTLAHAQTPSDGANPTQNLTLGSDGLFYGVTPHGGQYGYGSLFSFDPRGNGDPVVLHSFTDASGEGADPSGPLVEDEAGNFYGVTSLDNGNTTGTIYELTADGRFVTLYSFDEHADTGQNPVGALIEYAPGQFAGATYNGSVANAGSVYTFTVKPTASLLPALASGPAFYGLADTHGYDINIDKGSFPMAGLALAPNGLLYGTASRGGYNKKQGQIATIDAGTVYSFDPNSHAIRMIHSFGARDGYDGAHPMSPLIYANGLFYGTTVAGGEHYSNGTIYSIGLTGQDTVLQAFYNGDANGGSPIGPAALGSNGRLWITLSKGGIGDDGTDGTVCEVNRAFNNTGDSIFAFQGPSERGGDGATPVAGLTFNPADQSFYGMTEYGGTLNLGTIYKITQDTLQRTILHSFGPGPAPSS